MNTTSNGRPLPVARSGFVERLDRAFDLRNSNILRLAQSTSAMNWDLNALERELESLRFRFNAQPGRGQRRLSIRWLVNSDRYGLSMATGLQARRCSHLKGGEIKSMGRWPYKREVERHTQSDHVQARLAVLVRLRAVAGDYQIRHGSFRTALHLSLDANKRLALGVHVPSITTNSQSFVAARAHRQQGINLLEQIIRRLLARLRHIEHVMSAHVHAFNKAESRRRNGSLTVSYELRRSWREAKVGPKGPVFWTVHFDNGVRRRRRLKTGAQGANRPTKKALKSRYLTRYSRPLISEAEQIIQLRDDRDWVCDRLLSLYSYLNPQIERDDL